MLKKIRIHDLCEIYALTVYLARKHSTGKIAIVSSSRLNIVLALIVCASFDGGAAGKKKGEAKRIGRRASLLSDIIRVAARAQHPTSGRGRRRRRRPLQTAGRPDAHLRKGQTAHQKMPYLQIFKKTANSNGWMFSFSLEHLT